MNELMHFEAEPEIMEICKEEFGIGFPVVKLKGNKVKVMEARENLVKLMDHYRIKVKFDVYKRIPTFEGIKSSVGDDENLLVSQLKSLCGRHELPLRLVDHHLATIAQTNPINPPLDWLKTLKREKQSNPIADLVEALPVENKEWVKVAFNRWFIQACAAADTAENTPNIEALPKYESVLVFIGQQGLNKTTFIRRILPKHLHSYFSDGLLLNLDNKDSRLSATANWLVELGELDSTFRKSDISAMKAHLSKQVDEIRLPYAKSETRWNRRTCYLGSVNDFKFLHDTTGNRRYFPVVARAKLSIPEELDIKELWAYAWDQYINGAQWWLTPQEETLHLESLVAHESRPIAELVMDCFNFDLDGRFNKLTSKQILDRIGMKSDVKANQMRLKDELTRLGIQKDNRLYSMPPSRDGI